MDYRPRDGVARHDLVMLRLDPAHPPVWRTPSTLQFGADARAILTDTVPWQERLVRELEIGIPDSAVDPVALALGAPEGGASALLDVLRPVLIADEPLLRVRAVLAPSPVFESALVAAVTTGLASTGVQIVDDPAAEPPDIAVVIAHHAVEPRLVSGFMSADVRHVPIVFSGHGADVGPLVTPGRTPCTSCLAAHRRDADAAWPAVAAQLAHRAVPAIAGSLALEAGIAVMHLIREDARHPERSSTTSLVLHRDRAHREIRMHRPHAECRCRSLAGTARAAGSGAPAPTTERAYARPA